MFLGHLQEAREDYLSHAARRLEHLRDKFRDNGRSLFSRTSKFVVDEGRDDPLMTEIEQLLKVLSSRSKETRKMPPRSGDSEQ